MKNTKDRFSSGQKEFAKKLMEAEKKNPYVCYFIANEDNYKKIIEKIILMA